MRVVFGLFFLIVLCSQIFLTDYIVSQYICCQQWYKIPVFPAGEITLKVITG